MNSPSESVLDERSETVEAVLSDLPFSALPLNPALQANLRTVGFERCTPIQAKALPLALTGRDVAGQARTGTGKTAAFLLAIMDRLLNRPEDTGGQPRALILAPTRELAVQIHRDAEALGAGTGLRLGLAFGGIDYDKQRRAIEAGVDILIGTPGRLIDYFQQGVFNLKRAEVLVLDEADRMFDLGFIKDIRYLLRRLPPPDRRQSLMFSATLGWRVLELAYEHMNEPELVRFEDEEITARNIAETVYYPADTDKYRLLVKLFREAGEFHAIVFVNTRHAASRVADMLSANGFTVALLSGDVPQQKRLKLLSRFHAGEIGVLVATDVAARGLHIPDVTHVINFDLPQDASDYVHRIGRTARLGASGQAVSFACERYAFHLPEIEDYIGHPLPVGQYDPAALPVLEAPPARPPDRDRPRHGERRLRRRGGPR